MTENNQSLLNVLNGLDEDIQIGSMEEVILVGNTPKKIPLTIDEANLFANRDLAFKTLWGRRLVRGMKPRLKERFDQIVADFKASEESEPLDETPRFDRLLPTENVE